MIKTRPSFKTQVGYGLLEVLIAMVILVVGWSGIMAVYLHSFQKIDGSYRRTLEVIQLIEKSEKASGLSQ